MAAVYVDTSALGRVLLGEPDAPAVLAEIGRFEQRLSSALLRIELRRLGLRTGLLADADRLLAGVALVPVTPEVLRSAELVEPASVHALDAIHLASALALTSAGALDSIITFDRRLAVGARHHGLDVLAPG